MKATPRAMHLENKFQVYKYEHNFVHYKSTAPKFSTHFQMLALAYGILNWMRSAFQLYAHFTIQLLKGSHCTWHLVLQIQWILWTFEGFFFRFFCSFLESSLKLSFWLSQLSHILSKIDIKMILWWLTGIVKVNLFCITCRQVDL